MSDSEREYLTVAQAATYVGVSAATLRRWDSTGKLAAVRRPNSQYRFYKVIDLEPFRLEYSAANNAKDAIAGFFDTAVATVAGNAQLREPQKEAYDAAVEHFTHHQTPAIIQLPVGCGKTGVAAILPFALSHKRTLVIAPNTIIREGLYADLNISNASCFWKKTGVLESFTSGPFTALVDGLKANIEDCVNSHLVVANIQQLASSTDRWLSQFPSDFFDLVIVDEGHHIAAESWQKVVRAFPQARFVSLTATPFRSDNKDLLGELIYRYPFTRAMLNGYIKHIVSASAHPAAITFTADHDETITYTLEQILELNQEAWFRRGVALSDECNRHIAEKAVEKYRALRAATGFPHQIAAAAMSIDHADQVRAIFQEMGLQADTIHSRLTPERQAAVLAKLRNNQIDVIVQVNKLGEGFDHPPLSVAAIFRPYRSLSPYIQFVGRVMRTIDQNDPNSPNNQGFVVSHVGLNNEEQWDEFRDLDTQDQQTVAGWTRGEGESSTSRQDGGDDQSAQRFDNPVAQDEQISHFLSRSFLDPSDDKVIEQMLDAAGPGGFSFRELGISADTLRTRFAHRAAQQEAPADAVPVQPQVQRQTVRGRLDSRSKSVHQRILNDVGIPRAGYDISRSVKGVRGNNAEALYVLLNREINNFVGESDGSRESWSIDQLQIAYDSLDQVGDQVVRSIQTAIGG